MYLLMCNGVDWVPHRAIEPKTNSYAILSHRWREGEVEFRDIGKPGWKDKPGYWKIERLIRQTVKDGLDACWIDTCCIDKDSSAELSEAINSMYRWYQKAKVCYAYLDDVDSSMLEPSCQPEFFSHFQSEPGTFGDRETFNDGWTSVFYPIAGPLERSEWFKRGWTLQELLAPIYLTFYDKHWNLIATRSQLASMISSITGISMGVLLQNDPVHGVTVAQRMSWAAGRKTTRPEDRAYSLFGIFDVNMPMLYGEGTQAFRRLQEEILRSFGDYSLFCWEPQSEVASAFRDIFAISPDDFRSDVDTLEVGLLQTDRSAPLFSSRGLEITLPIVQLIGSRGIRLGLLDVAGHDSEGNFIYALRLYEAGSQPKTGLRAYLSKDHPRARLTQPSSETSGNVYQAAVPRLQRIRPLELNEQIQVKTILIQRRITEFFEGGVLTHN